MAVMVAGVRLKLKLHAAEADGIAFAKGRGVRLKLKLHAAKADGIAFAKGNTVSDTTGFSRVVLQLQPKDRLPNGESDTTGF